MDNSYAKSLIVVVVFAVFMSIILDVHPPYYAEYTAESNELNNELNYPQHVADVTTKITIGAQEKGVVLGRSYPPSAADVVAGAGGVVKEDGVSVIVSEGTFSKDMYARVDRITRGTPVYVNGLWQISDMWNVRLRYLVDDNEIPVVDTKKSVLFGFTYTENYLVTDQGQYLPETSLKLARSDSSSGPWEVVEESVVDVWNNSVSALMNRGGYFIVVGGYESAEGGSQTAVGGSGAGASKTTQTVQSKSNKNNVILEPNEIVVTITPQPTEIKNAQIATEQSKNEQILITKTRAEIFIENMKTFLKSIFGTLQ